jgi:hypothetical protein
MPDFFRAREQGKSVVLEAVKGGDGDQQVRGFHIVGLVDNCLKGLKPPNRQGSVVKGQNTSGELPQLE